MKLLHILIAANVIIAMFGFYTILNYSNANIYLSYFLLAYSTIVTIVTLVWSGITLIDAFINYLNYHIETVVEEKLKEREENA